MIQPGAELPNIEDMKHAPSSHGLTIKVVQLNSIPRLKQCSMTHETIPSTLDSMSKNDMHEL